MTCLSFFLVEALPQLADALVHERHLHVALVEEILLLLQLAVLLQVQFVADLRRRRHGGVDGLCRFSRLVSQLLLRRTLYTD